MIGGFSFLDLITNVIGGAIGYCAYRIIYRETRIRMLNAISIAFLSLATPTAIFAILSTIANIDFYIDVVLRKI
jgi:glycopeptide antibiotics resistance protein